MILAEVLFLSRYLKEGHKLTTREAAAHIWQLEVLSHRSCTRVDFSGITGADISGEFVSELFRLDLPDNKGVWLVPVNFSRELAPLVAGCLAKLKRRRVASMREGFIKAGLHFETEPERS